MIINESSVILISRYHHPTPLIVYMVSVLEGFDPKISLLMI